MGMAAGIIEVYGLVAALVAVDAGCKAANVTVEPLDKNKPNHPERLNIPLIIVIKFRGGVEEVKAAVDAAARAARDVSESEAVVTTHIMPNVDEQISRSVFKHNGLEKY